jgi:hypothetical protein
MFEQAARSKLKSCYFEEEAKVIAKNTRGWAARSVFVASIALVFGLADAQQSFAGCGGYCEARQARAICHDAVKAQGLRAQAREAEFEKCKADPASYLQLDQLTDDAETTVE